MGVAETADLAVRLSLDDKRFTGPLNRIDKRLGAFSGAVNRNLGKLVDRGIERGVRLLTDAFQGGIAALKEDNIVAAQTAAVIKSTGGAAGLTADAVADLSDKLSRLNGVQDDVVQGTANLLLTFTNIKANIFPAVTQAAIDMSAALGQDTKSSAIQLGKALNDPVKGITALQRVGVSFTKDQKAQIADLVKHNKLRQAQAIILKEIQREFGGVAKAQADADPGRRLTLSVERLQKAFAKNLLPVVEKVQLRLTEFLDKPETTAAIQRIGETIAGLFTDQNLNLAASSIETAAKAVGTAVSAFNSLPPEIKALAIGALAINKVTGGAVGGLAKALGGALGAGLNKIFAANVTVIGANVTGGGGVPGVGGIGSVAAGGGVAAVAGAAGVGAAALAGGLVISQAIKDASGQSQKEWDTTVENSYRRLGLLLGPKVDNTTAAVKSLADFRAGERASRTPTVSFREGERVTSASDTASAVDKLRAKLAATINAEGRAIRNGNTRRAAALERKADALRAKIGEASAKADAKAAQTKATVSTGNVLQRVANAKLAAISRKPTRFTSNTVVNVSTAISVSYLKKQTRYMERVVKTGTLVAS